MSRYIFSCGIMENLNGYKLKNIEPDANGFFPMVIGSVGYAPTRAGVIYDPDTLLACMSNPHGRFNTCLRDGNLCGEYGHPDIRTKEDIPRLMRIVEANKSHYFGKIWLGEPIRIDGEEHIPIHALVKPCGPKGDVLEKELRDPCHNTSFSIRCLCQPAGEKNGCEFRKVEVLVTFDTVHAPGFAMTSKRYVPGTESLDSIEVTKRDLVEAIHENARIGQESVCMLTDQDIHRIYGDKEYTLRGDKIASDIVGKRTVLGVNGQFRDAATLAYR